MFQEGSVGLGRRPSNDDEGFFVSADFKCFRKGVWGLGRGPTNDDERFFVSADFKCLRKGVWGWGGGPLMMMKHSLFLQISNDLGRGCRAGEGGHL